LKKIYSRSEFEDARNKWAENMDQDQSLKNKALDVFIEADRHNWIHQTSWLGEPSLQTPEDLITFQEIIFRTKPDFLLEVGVAWAGSLLFYAG
jgi:cephalosporin hydroxylase